MSKQVNFDDLDSFSLKTIKQNSKSFALASKIFDPETQRATVLLYLWCRHCDDAIDSGDKISNKKKQLHRITNDIDLIYKNETPSTEVDSLAFKNLIAQVAIQQHYPQELLAGMGMDLDQAHYEKLDDLLLYCYRVAGVVGLMMCSIMRVNQSAALPHACSLGVAMQLTNICRDIVADARINRIYLPQNLLPHPSGLNPHYILNEANWPELHAASLQLLDIAERFYQDAEKGIEFLSFRNAITVLSARYIYSSIGDMIRVQGPFCWRNRIYTSFLKKLSCIVLAIVKTVQIKFFGTAKKNTGSSDLNFYSFENFQNHYKKFV